MNIKQYDKRWHSNPKYYDSNILRTSTDDNGHSVDIAFVYSGRNRGKSFEIASRAIEDAWRTAGEEQFGYVRRHEKEMKLSNITKYFDDKHELFKDLSDGQADGICAASDGLYFYKEQIVDGKAKQMLLFKCGDYFALTSATQYKSLQYPKITRLIFEEVFTDDAYLPNECDKLMSIISTVQRDRPNFIAYLISNLVSRINPYVRGLSLNKMVTQKAGTIDFYRLYKGVLDEDGNEMYYYIAVEYLQDAENLIEKKALLPNRSRITSITSNSWEEKNQYIHASNKVMCGYFTDNKAVFEWNNDRFLATICNVPINIEEIIKGSIEEYEVKPKQELFDILYVERKTTEPYFDTRTYTNIARVTPYCTHAFRRKYPIDDVIGECLEDGYIVYADNLTGNEFNQILRDLF